ncbi:MAG TPA: hypothetical protein VFX30_12235 [bacterium]|nr:hypothetical protein [bacterium]
MNGILDTATASDGMGLAKWGMIATCFSLGILRQLASGALDGDLRLAWGHLLARLLFVILFVSSAGVIQGSIWGAGQSIGESLLPGPTLVDMNLALHERVKSIQEAKAAEAEKTASETEESALDKLNPAKLATKMINLVFGTMMQGLEMLALSVFFIAYKFLQSAQNSVMMFLAAMVPFIIPPSVIPGVNTWSSWLKMVISVALWPVVAGFLIKGHLSSAAEWLAGPSSDTGGAIEGLMSGDVKNLFINMDSLGLLAEALVYAFMLLSAPFLSAALVYGSATALGTGAATVMAAGLTQVRQGLHGASFAIPAYFGKLASGGQGNHGGNSPGDSFGTNARSLIHSGSHSAAGREPHSARYREGGSE